MTVAYKCDRTSDQLMIVQYVAVACCCDEQTIQAIYIVISSVIQYFDLSISISLSKFLFKFRNLSIRTVSSLHTESFNIGPTHIPYIGTSSEISDLCEIVVLAVAEAPTASPLHHSRSILDIKPLAGPFKNESI